MSKLFQAEDWHTLLVDTQFCSLNDDLDGAEDQIFANYYGFVEDSWFNENPDEWEIE